MATAQLKCLESPLALGYVLYIQLCMEDKNTDTTIMIALCYMLSLYNRSLMVFHVMKKTRPSPSAIVLQVIKNWMWKGLGMRLD